MKKHIVLDNLANSLEVDRAYLICMLFEGRIPRILHKSDFVIPVKMIPEVKKHLRQVGAMK